MRKLGTSAVDAGQQLGAWLAARLGVPEGAARALVRGGSVYLDGRREQDDRVRLTAGARVTVHVPRVAPAAAALVPWRIAHEDRDVIVVNKSAGLATQAGRDSAESLERQVAARVPGARLLHRIDRDTSGLVLFTRRDKARARLQQALARGEITREYLAVVDGHPAADAFVLDAPIGRDPADARRRRVHGAGARPARTRVEVLHRGLDAAGAPAAAVLARLDTGRTHQIRVHLAAAGHPILGDPVYAPPAAAARAPRLALHALRLAWPGGRAQAAVPEDLASLLPGFSP